MKLEVVIIQGSIEPILANRYDAIWLLLGESHHALPFESSWAEWIDWRLSGQVSRWVIQHRNKGPTFISTLKKLPVAFVVVEDGAHWKQVVFFQACEGLQFQSVLVLCEDSVFHRNIETSVGELIPPIYPKLITLGISG